MKLVIVSHCSGEFARDDAGCRIGKYDKINSLPLRLARSMPDYKPMRPGHGAFVITARQPGRELHRA
jgi:hypothetical protein